MASKSETTIQFPELDRLMAMDKLTLVNKVLHLRFALHAVAGAIQASATDTILMESPCPQTVADFIENTLVTE